jgi:hypothetical protein
MDEQARENMRSKGYMHAVEAVIVTLGAKLV